MTETTTSHMVYCGRLYTPLSTGGWVDFPDGALVVGEDGRIAWVGEKKGVPGQYSQAVTADHRGMLILPGFVDCHQHLCHYEWVRLVPDLMKWLKSIYKIEAKFEDVEYAQEISRLFFRELARNGTTTCCVHGPYFRQATDAAFVAAKESGLCVLMGMNAGDVGLPEPLRRDAPASMEDAKALCEKWDGANEGLLSWCFTVRPAYCASDSLLRAVGAAAAKRRARVQCHLGEDQAGQQQILARFPDCRTEVDVYDERGLLTPRSIMAHGVYLSANDFAKLAERRVAVAHCPRANLLAGGRQFNAGAAMTAGLRVGLGTDLGAGKGLSLFRTMEDATKVTSKLSIHDVFRLATLGGAEVLGVEAETGSLEEGKSADFVVFNAPCCRVRDDVTLPEIDDVLASLLFRGDDRCVVSARVRGREVLGDQLRKENVG